MIRFNNDYNHGAHPEILEALGAINGNSYGGYGEDEWCEKAAELIREKRTVHFIASRTKELCRRKRADGHGEWVTWKTI